MKSLRSHTAALAAILASLPVAAAAQETMAAVDPEPVSEPPMATTAAGQPPLSELSTAHDPAPFQLSLWDSVQVIDRDRSIHGVRLTLPYGNNWNVRGLDIGIVNRTQNDLTGVQLSFAGVVEGDMQGLQYNWLASWVDGEAQGAQFGMVNGAGSLEGAQFGAVNYAREGMSGAGFGFVNVSEGQSVGAQLGIVNYASRIEGLQIGLVNTTDHLHGVQIGLVNVARNGFLPVFVIFNAAL